MMNRNDIHPLTIENAHLIFRNFAGRSTKYQREGTRSFSVLIDDPDDVAQLTEDGWNVRILRPTTDDGEPRHCIDVSINYNFWKKPEVFLLCNGHKTLLDEEDLDRLDSADIINADLVLRPRLWDDNGETRIKAYLQEMYVEIEQSRLANKYAHYGED